jgi:hypothetical protein
MAPSLPRTSPQTGEGLAATGHRTKRPTALQTNLPRHTGVHPHPTYGEVTLFPGTPRANAARLAAHRTSAHMVCHQPLNGAIRSSQRLPERAAKEPPSGRLRSRAITAFWSRNGLWRTRRVRRARAQVRPCRASKKRTQEEHFRNRRRCLAVKQAAQVTRTQSSELRAR